MKYPGSGGGTGITLKKKVKGSSQVRRQGQRLPHRPRQPHLWPQLILSCLWLGSLSAGKNPLVLFPGSPVSCS